jgi:hypothetical protein
LRFMLHGKGGRGEIGQFTSTDAENFWWFFANTNLIDYAGHSRENNFHETQCLNSFTTILLAKLLEHSTTVIKSGPVSATSAHVCLYRIFHGTFSSSFLCWNRREFTITPKMWIYRLYQNQSQKAQTPKFLQVDSHPHPVCVRFCQLFCVTFCGIFICFAVLFK